MGSIVAAAFLLLAVFDSGTLGERCTCADKIVLLLDEKDFRLVNTPDYPRPYCADLDCTWRVVAPSNESQIQFYSANLDLSPSDSIVIFDGDRKDQVNASLRLLTCTIAETECTEKDICNFVSSGQYMTIEFVSGRTENNHKGFQGAVIVLNNDEPGGKGGTAIDHHRSRFAEMASYFYLGGLVLLVFAVALTIGALILCCLRKRSRTRTPHSERKNDALLEG